MKAALTLLLVAITTAGFSQKNETSSDIYGTWQMVSSSAVRGSETVRRDSTQFAQYKVITPNFFMYTAYRKGVDTLMIATTGTLTYNGKEMTHTATYSTAKARVGVTATYTVTVKGNHLYQKGKLGNQELDEVWVRLY